MTETKYIFECRDQRKKMNLKEQLSRKERITYHYRSKPNPNQHKFFEAQAIKIYQGFWQL